MRHLRRLLAFDVAPDTSDRVRRWVGSPLGCLLLGAGAAALCGLAVHPRVFALAGGLLLVAAAGVCWPWLTVRGVNAGVRFDRERTTEGAEVGVSATVTNHLPWPGWVLGLMNPGGGSVVGLPAVGGRARHRCRWAFTPPGRGEYPTAPPELVSGFPFGLWRAARPAAVAGRLLVWPRTYPVGPVPAAGGEDATDGAPLRNRTGGHGDVVGVRPYRRGDSPRRIHWAQSAKHDRLVVCELQPTTRPAVLLVLDTDAAVHSPEADGSFEWAVRVTASLAKGWLDAGARVGLACGDTIVPLNAGAGQVTRVLDALARVATDTKPLGDVLASAALRGVCAGTRVVVTTDAGCAGVRDAAGVRWAILRRAGFGGPETARPTARPWLDLPTPAAVPHQLRHGTPEASHGD